MNQYGFRGMLQKLFYGRYGSDNFNIFLLVLSLIVARIPYIMIVSYFLIGYALFRMFSKNLYKRQNELQKYNQIIGFRLSRFFSKATLVIKQLIYTLKIKLQKQKQRQYEKQSYIFFKCKNCQNTLKVPKNKGTLKVTCPVCKNATYKKT